MPDQIRFTTDGKILFKDGKIVFNDECCCDSGCEFCDPQPGTVDFSLAGIVNAGGDPCADCADLNATFSPTEAAPCVWLLNDVAACAVDFDLRIADVGGGMAKIELIVFRGFEECIFSLSLAYPFDCSATQSLPQISNTFTTCDMSAATATWMP